MITDLERLGYLNDQEFARSWVDSQLRRKPRSRRFLAHELREKGIPPAIRQEVIGEVFRGEEEWRLALAAAERRLRSYRRLEGKILRRRLAGYLSREGFPAEMVWEVIGELETRRKLA